MFKSAVALSSLMMFVLPACSGPEFTSGAPAKKVTENKSTAPENVQQKSSDNTAKNTRTAASPEGVAKEQKPAAAPENVKIPENQFAAPGLSLDLHAIMDISGSLTEAPIATDPNCLRFKALKSFFGALKNKLGEKPDARLSITVFNSSADFKGTFDGFLDLSESQLDKKFERVVCASSGRTNAGEAFKIANEQAKLLMQDSPKKVSTVLFFSDGLPTVGSIADTLKKAEKLRETFGNRIFGVQLGSAPKLPGVPAVLGLPVVLNDATEFMENAVGSKKRVRKVDNVDDLENALTSLLE